MSQQHDDGDPMELVAVALEGADPAEALDQIVVEYLSMGWPEEQIRMLFRSPCYGATHQLWRSLGPENAKARIAELAREWRGGWISGGGHHG
ncbi:MAG: hypothetical protein FJ039_06050 [Chloroflexi bacterium]|nr:hypothetical protein [Chloroflexota bacterium]